MHLNATNMSRRGIATIDAASIEDDADYWTGPSVCIEIRAGELPAIVEKAQLALIAAEAGIYQRGGTLVRVVRLGKALEINGVSRSAGSVFIAPVSRDYLLVALARAVDFRRFDRRHNGWRRVDAPVEVAAAMLAMVGEWRFPELSGLVASPTLRADGTLLSKRGFDSASGLYLSTTLQFPDITVLPSREDALAAVKVLRNLLREFAFASDEHLAAAMAAIISAGVRYMLRIAPAYGFNSYAPGSGKTTLAQTIAHIWTGADAPVMPLAESESELRKVILAALLTGDPILLIDNIERPVSSGTLCAALTAPIFADRVLGLSKRATAPTTCTWIATGNNLQFQGDLTSRVIYVTLDPPAERPDLRAYERDLTDFVAKNRGELVRAALTIPLAYIAAGRPPVDCTASRFTDWSVNVRQPLIWLGLRDPAITQEELRQGDDERTHHASLMTAWREVFGDRSATVAEAIAAANEVSTPASLRLLESLRTVADDRDGGVNSRSLGRYLSRYQRRIESGLRIEDGGRDPQTSRRRFRVFGVSSVSGVSGVSNTQL